MAPSKSLRQKAWDGLKRISSDRVDKHGALHEIFHWGIVEPDGGRDPDQDRPTALLAAAVVEHALEHAIVWKMLRTGPDARALLFESEGAILRDLSAKITMAYVLGIVGPQTRSDMSAIRRIRNAFAHSRLKIDFDTPEIEAACQQITVLSRLQALGQSSGPKSMRNNYLTSCFEFSVWLFTIDDDRTGIPTSGSPPRAQLSL